MKKLLTLSTLAMALTLSACGDKPADTAKADTPAPATSENTASATPATTSPYMDFAVSSNRAMIVMDVDNEFELTPEQKACLQSPEGNANYLATLDPYVKSILSDDEIKEADEFFASSAGQKLSQAILSQLGMGEAPTGEPTAEEQAELAKAMTKPFFVKMQSHQDAMSEEEAIAFMTPMIEKEIERCQISK